MNHSKRSQIGSRDPRGDGGDQVLRRLKSLIGKSSLVYSLGYTIPYFGVSISGSAIWHGSNLALDISPQPSSELYYKGPRIHVAYIRD